MKMRLYRGHFVKKLTPSQRYNYFARLIIFPNDWRTQRLKVYRKGNPQERRKCTVLVSDRLLQMNCALKIITTQSSGALAAKAKSPDPFLQRKTRIHFQRMKKLFFLGSPIESQEVMKEKPSQKPRPKIWSFDNRGFSYDSE